MVAKKTKKKQSMLSEALDLLIGGKKKDSKKRSGNVNQNKQLKKLDKED